MSEQHDQHKNPAPIGTKNQLDTAIEQQSLLLSKWLNLLMAAAGITAAYLSHSDALLVDGLYSGVNFIAAIVAARVGMAVLRPPDQRYPFGYDAHESLYVTFRSLLLIGILTYAVFSAVAKIITYATGGQVPELVFGPILVYIALMMIICFGLGGWHYYNLRRLGMRSEILRVESKAAILDGVISAGAGGGILAISLLRGTALEILVPIADSIIVLMLTTFIARQPVEMFLSALREVAGEAADPSIVEQVRTCTQTLLQDRLYTVTEVTVTKMGRNFFVVPYLKPQAPVSAEALDALRDELKDACYNLLGEAKFEIIITNREPYRQEE